MQKPSPGRMVHFNNEGVREPSMVLHVYSDTCVKLRSLTTLNLHDSVQYHAEAEGTTMLNNMFTQDNTWSWPPVVK